MAEYQIKRALNQCRSRNPRQGAPKNSDWPAPLTGRGSNRCFFGSRAQGLRLAVFREAEFDAHASFKCFNGRCSAGFSPLAKLLAGDQRLVAVTPMLIAAARLHNQPAHEQSSTPARAGKGALCSMGSMPAWLVTPGPPFKRRPSRNTACCHSPKPGQSRAAGWMGSADVEAEP